MTSTSRRRWWFE